MHFQSIQQAQIRDMMPCNFKALCKRTKMHCTSEQNSGNNIYFGLTGLLTWLFLHTSFPTVLYFLPISPFFTSPPQYLVKGTNYEAPHYIIFSSLLVLAMYLKTLNYSRLSPIIQTYVAIQKCDSYKYNILSSWFHAS